MASRTIVLRHVKARSRFCHSSQRQWHARRAYWSMLAEETYIQEKVEALSKLRRFGRGQGLGLSLHSASNVVLVFSVSVGRGLPGV